MRCLVVLSVFACTATAHAQSAPPPTTAGMVPSVPPPPPLAQAGQAAPWTPGATQPSPSGETFATLNIPSVGSPLPIYTPTPNGRWSLLCYTPCTLRVAVGNVTIATIPDGRDAITIPVPPEGRSYQPEFTQRPVATVVNPSGYSGAQSLASIGVTPAQLSENRNGPGLSPGGVVFVAGLSISVVSVVVGTVAFVNLGTRSSSGLWLPVFFGSIAGLLVGGVLTTVGTYMGIGYNSSGSRLAFAPIITPEMQGVGMSIRF